MKLKVGDRVRINTSAPCPREFAGCNATVVRIHPDPDDDLSEVWAAVDDYVTALFFEDELSVLETQSLPTKPGDTTEANRRWSKWH